MADPTNKDAGEFLEIEDDADVKDTEDGGAIVTLDEEQPDGERAFYDNLADTLEPPKLTEIATDLLKRIDQDKEARKKRDEQYEEGLRRTGLGNDAPGGAEFQGASRVVHPMLTEASVDFAARAIKELFPPSGPAKDLIPGRVTQEKLDKAHRKTKHMNRQLTVDMKEFRSELEQLLTQLPLGGGQYMKLYWDKRLKRPTSLFIPIDDIYIPFSATNFYTAERKTHVQYITEAEYRRRVASGMYVDVDLPKPEADPERSAADVANDKIEGRAPDAYNADGLRTIYEVYCHLDIEAPIEDAEIEVDNENETLDPEEPAPKPYIVTIDKSTQQILSVYRNWEEDDEKHEELVHIVEFPFVPWRGAYPIGLTHMIGGLSAAATGALRALLDTAHINNIPTLLKLKGGSAGGQSLNLQATGVTEIEGGLNVDDVRKLAMPLPFNPPSPVLFQLLGALVDAGRGVVRTTFENLSDGANPNMPVGTTLALIEQGQTVFSAIHARLHAAMQNVLAVLHRLNKMHLDERVELEEEGELYVRRKDYEGPIDVVPVSDPNIFSETQRFAQMQAIAQRAAMMPQLYDQRKVEEMILKRLRIPEGEKLLVEKPEPKKMNAVNENLAATMGRPVVAFPDQDHLAHIQVHMDFLRSPVLGANPLLAPKFMGAILPHIAEHMTFWYATHVFEVTSGAVGDEISKFMDEDAEVSKEMDRLLAAASPRVVEAAGRAFEKLPPIIMQAMQLLQSMQPQMPTDPTVAAAAASQAETQRKAAADQAKAQADQAKTQIEAAKLAEKEKDRAAELQREEMRQDAEDERTEFEVGARVGMNDADNQTARDLAQMEIASGERIAVSTGTGINPSP